MRAFPATMAATMTDLLEALNALREDGQRVLDSKKPARVSNEYTGKVYVPEPAQPYKGLVFLRVTNRKCLNCQHFFEDSGHAVRVKQNGTTEWVPMDEGLEFARVEVETKTIPRCCKCIGVDRD